MVAYTFGVGNKWRVKCTFTFLLYNMAYSNDQETIYYFNSRMICLISHLNRLRTILPTYAKRHPKLISESLILTCLVRFCRGSEGRRRDWQWILVVLFLEFSTHFLSVDNFIAQFNSSNSNDSVLRSAVSSSSSLCLQTSHLLPKQV